MKKSDGSIEGARLQFIAVTSITIFEMWCVPPWLYLFKSVSVSTPLVAAERDGLLGGGVVWWSGRGADEELYFPRIHELTEQPGGRRPDAVKVRLWSTAGSLCVKFVSKLTVTPTKETIIGSILASWRCADLIGSFIFLILLLSTH